MGVRDAKQRDFWTQTGSKKVPKNGTSTSRKSVEISPPPLFFWGSQKNEGEDCEKKFRPVDPTDPIDRSNPSIEFGWVG